jgi:hypothetical protein
MPPSSRLGGGGTNTLNVGASKFTIKSIYVINEHNVITILKTKIEDTD